MNELEQFKLKQSNYGFSGVKIDDLTTATEYTLVTLVLDESGSTGFFRSEMEKCLKEIVKACRYSPRADNLMLRLVAFGTAMREVHGFKLLESCNLQDYDGCYRDGGSTALFDSSYNAIEATMEYAKQLSKSDYMVNAIIFVLTDGDDNVSRFTPKKVREILSKCVSSEAMESLVSVLIGVNVQTPELAQYLDNFHKEAGFTQFVNLEDASDKTLAKLAAFVSKSISSQSKSLGTGSAAQSLTF